MFKPIIDLKINFNDLLEEKSRNITIINIGQFINRPLKRMSLGKYNCSFTLIQMLCHYLASQSSTYGLQWTVHIDDTYTLPQKKQIQQIFSQQFRELDITFTMTQPQKSKEITSAERKEEIGLPPSKRKKLFE